MEKKKISKRTKIPQEYVTGQATFMGLTLFCTQDTLIPREETELLTRVALEYIHNLQELNEELTIIDMGTGSGNICVALAMNSDHTRILASDLSPSAIEVAKKNARKYKSVSYFPE